MRISPSFGLFSVEGGFGQNPENTATKLVQKIPNMIDGNKLQLQRDDFSAM